MWRWPAAPPGRSPVLALQTSPPSPPAAQCSAVQCIGWPDLVSRRVGHCGRQRPESVRVVSQLVTLADAVGAVPQHPPPPRVHLHSQSSSVQSIGCQITLILLTQVPLLPSRVPSSYSTQSYRLFPPSSAIHTFTVAQFSTVKSSVQSTNPSVGVEELAIEDATLTPGLLGAEQILVATPGLSKAAVQCSVDYCEAMAFLFFATNFLLIIILIWQP